MVWILPSECLICPGSDDEDWNWRNYGGWRNWSQYQQDNDNQSEDPDRPDRGDYEQVPQQSEHGSETKPTAGSLVLHHRREGYHHINLLLILPNLMLAALALWIHSSSTF